MAMVRVDLQVADVEAQAPITGLARNVLFLLDVAKNPVLILVLAAVTGGAFWVMNQSNTLSATEAAGREAMEQQQKDSARFSKQLLDAKNLKERQVKYEKLVGRIRGVDDNRYAFAHLMDDIARALPADSWLQSLSTVAQSEMTRNVSVDIKGYAPNETAVTDYIQRMNESPWLTNASIVKVDRVPVNRQIIISFELVVDTEIPDQIWLTTAPISKIFGVETPFGKPDADTTAQTPPPNQ